MPLLDTFKAEQQPFNLVFSRQGALDAHPQRLDGFVEAAFASTLRGLTVAGRLFDIGDQAGLKKARAMVRGIKTAVQVKGGTTAISPHLFCHLF
jgi:hypothetical protein